MKRALAAAAALTLATSAMAGPFTAAIKEIPSGGHITFALWEDQPLLPECRILTDNGYLVSAASVHLVDQDGAGTMVGHGCWMAQDDGNIRLFFKDGDNELKVEEIHNSRFHELPIE